jgi:DNA-binding NarL/FixJ family response regulator
MDRAPSGKVMRLCTAHPWTLLLIDPHDFTRQCLADLLAGGDAELTVRTATSAETLVADDCVGCSSVLMRLDDGEPQQGALPRRLARLGDLLPGAPIALLGGCCDTEAALEAIRLGARGYLSPSQGIEQVLAVLRLLRGGGVFIAPDCGAPAPAQAARRPPPPAGLSDLTPREAEVLSHLRQGKPNKAIAYQLGMAENTVKAHVGHILKKLGAASRTAIASLPESARDG